MKWKEGIFRGIAPFCIPRAADISGETRQDPRHRDWWAIIQNPTEFGASSSPITHSGHSIRRPEVCNVCATARRTANICRLLWPVVSQGPWLIDSMISQDRVTLEGWSGQPHSSGLQQWWWYCFPRRFDASVHLPVRRFYGNGRKHFDCVG